LAFHIASHAYDKSYDNIENFREALDYCGKQWKHLLSVRKTEKDVKKKVLYNFSIGTSAFWASTIVSSRLHRVSQKSGKSEKEESIQ
jgi:hypothetical protein